MAEREDDRVDWCDFISFLRWFSGEIGSQADFARKTGIDRSAINRYAKGLRKPQPGTRRHIAERTGVPERLLGFLRWCQQLIRKAQPLANIEAPPRPPRRLEEETRAAVWGAVERAQALARAERALLRSRPRPAPAEQDPERVEGLFQKLLSYPADKQRLLIQGAKAYRDPLLCLRLCKESEKAAADDPADALKTAELALFLAQHVPAPLGPRLQGWCTGHIANVHRVVGRDLPSAGTMFARTWRLWAEGEDPAGLLSKAYLLDMEASLRRDQGLFAHALKLHEDALALARSEEIGVILLNQAVTREETGDPEGALRSLERAAQAIEGDRQPRHRWVLRYNQATSLLVLGRATEAAPIVAEVRGLAEKLRNDLDLLKTSWLEAKCAAGLGQREEALAKLEQVRHAFEVREYPFEYALASLDVALVYREEGRNAEIKALAGEMLKIFKAQKVQREAIASVILFQEAAEKEQVTAALIRRLQEQLTKAKSGGGPVA